VTATKKERKLSPTKRRKLVRDSQLLYLSVWRHDDVKPEFACLFHAAALHLLAAKRHGLQFMLQAGTCYWPRHTPETDPHKDADAPLFGYEWEGEKRVKRVAFCEETGTLRELMPEIHCWLALRHEDGSGTIVDPTTSTWPKRAEIEGHSWPGRRPPPYLWDKADELNDRYGLGLGLEVNYSPIYHPSKEACEFAGEMADESIYPKLAKALGLSMNARQS
jgi:hypothetical protein